MTALHHPQTTATAPHTGRFVPSLPGTGLCALLLLIPSIALGLTTSALQDQTCAGFRAGALNCTAGEFTVSPVFSAAPGTPPMCVAGQSFNFKVDLGLSGTNTDRYDIGFFVGQQGNDPRAATAGNICSVATFPKTPSPWEDDDGDACGDFDGGGNQTTTIDEIKVVCQADGAGFLQIPFVLTYYQNTGLVCTGPTNVSNASPSKCNSGVSSVSGTVKVYSGAYVDVTKQTIPDGDAQDFSFTATGPAGSAVVAQIGSSYTPAADPTNTTTVSLRDGQSARFFINALSTSQTLTISEAANSGWESSATLSCAPVTGSPALTTTNSTRTITAGLSSSNSAAACTITNTKSARVTLAKNVVGRADVADQFTVSASGGGTLVGTISATTAGADTSASTTFFSSPGALLTLTDAKAAGPTPLSGYESHLTCTNAYTGPGATPNASLPNGLTTSSTSFTPAPADDITCTYTNTAKPLLTKAFSTDTIGVGQTATLTFTLTNPAGAPAHTGGLTFTDSLPAGLVMAATPNVVNSCGGTPTITATGGTGTFTVGGTGVNLAAGTSSCTVGVDVTSATPLSGYVNGAAQITAISSLLRNGVSNQTLNVTQGSLNKAFSPTTINQLGISTLTFTLINGAGNPAQSGIAFTDTLPTHVVVAPSPTVTTTCPSGTGVVTATPGSGSVTVNGASLNSGQASCTISLNVTSNRAGGPYTNTNANISGTTRITTNVTSSGLTVNAIPLPLVSILKSANIATANSGDTVVYTVQIANSGTDNATDVVLQDELSPYVAYGLNSYGPGIPFSFIDSVPASGLALGSPQYSNDRGSSWVYVPISGGGGAPAGYDGNITNWRIPMTGALLPNRGIVLNYQAMVK